MKRGVSLYSYQQSQFFKESTLESQLNEVANNLYGADGIELIDEMSIKYPVPDKAFMQRWYRLIDIHGLNPVAMDVSMDVLQFRSHVMSHEECAERLRSDIKLAKTLGFSIVRVLSIVPLDVMVKALPLAEALDIRIGKEI
ncbi:xylose isomerase, partial [Salmonella enterica subsp. enterica serovar Kentucky]|nr:xylose isomerase [Salmonella enterica]EBM7848417.1 xylose isomerase [Salmonella enterica subsp. enterica serovar Kentucky]ECB6648472.1 xylose isomerase [Salmonella enterica subsp. enterica serovar Rissen]EAA9345478.1 xylose isomerase [Salmonella enterica]EAN8456426.1 xylose isomerase [Salmonella enterica]